MFDRRPIVSGAMIAVFALTASVGAQEPNIYVWFEATGLNASSSVFQPGEPGEDLILRCDTSAGPTKCDWSLSMKFVWDTGAVVSVVSSMATDILGDTNKHAITNMQPGDYPLDGYSFDEINAGGQLVDTRAVQVPVTGNPPMFEVIPPGIYTLLTAHLSTDKAAGELGVDALDMRVNSLLWTLTSPALPEPQAVIQFGDAPAIPGTIAGGIAEDVIQIQNVPEPAVISLLSLFLLGIHRRRD